ncbi:MAG: SH3 domain-containing protein [Oscillospiraceae bacterium]|jgi:hypothetical protein|nr:SH3 domain-containing protein [Oscillospiraceae bacterium]
MKRRSLAFFIVFAIIASGCPAYAGTVETLQADLQGELDIARSVGILSEDFSPEGDCTVGELISLLENAVVVKTGLPYGKEWGAGFPFPENDETIDRAWAARLLYEGFLAMGWVNPNIALGVDFEAGDGETNAPLTDENGRQITHGDLTDYQEFGAALTMREDYQWNYTYKEPLTAMTEWLIGFVIAQRDLLNGKRVMEIDGDNYFNAFDPLTRVDAVLAVKRLFFSYIKDGADRSASAEPDAVVVGAIDDRRAKILGSPTSVDVAGTKYYVSNSGDDGNDGLSPETAWRTLDKVNGAATYGWADNDSRWNNPHFAEFQWAYEHKKERPRLKRGDGVFFERGGLWRGTLQAVAGVTYSAYGEGEKPRIYGSPENGAGAEKWSIASGTENVWVFYKDLQDCGGILLNGGETAAKQTALWYNREYYSADERSWPTAEELPNLNPFSIYELDDMSFFNDIRYVNDFVEYGESGKLYMRCDQGNPGEVFNSIEFITGSDDWGAGVIRAADGCIIDNISIGFCGSGICIENDTTVQNCEISWVGGIVGGYNATGLGLDAAFAIIRSGDSLTINGSNNRAIGNYIHHAPSYAITIETYFMGDEVGSEYDRMIRENCLVGGNLIEYCNGGVLAVCWNAYGRNLYAPLFRGIRIENNMIHGVGYGGWNDLPINETDPYYDFADVCVRLNPGCENVTVTDNVLYATRPEATLLSLGFSNGETDTMSFSGNVFAQNLGGNLLHLQNITAGSGDPIETYKYDYNFAKTVGEIVGDASGIVLPLTNVYDANDVAVLTQKIDDIKAIEYESAASPKPARQLRAIADANIRAQANTDSAIVGKVKSGDVLDFLGAADNGWYNVVLTDGTVGYISPKLAAIID